MVQVIPLLVDGHIHQPLGVLSLPVLGRLSCAIWWHVYFHSSPTVFWWRILHPHVGPWGAHSGRLVQRGFRGRSSTAEVLTVTEGDRMCVGERKKWPCCVAGELGRSILLTCLTPGRKPVARLWTESRMSVSSLLSPSLSRTTVSAAFSSCCSSCSAARYAITAYLLSWIYWHSGNRLQDLRKTSKCLKSGL